MAGSMLRSRKYAPVTIKKAFKILRLFLDERRGLGTSEVARRLSFAKSTAFGILEDLTQEGWISKDPVNKKYALGEALMELAWTLSNQLLEPAPTGRLKRGRTRRAAATPYYAIKRSPMARSGLLTGGM